MSGTHILTGEHSRLRRWTLYIFARYVEMPLLAWGYRLLRGQYRRWRQNRLVRAALGWLVAAPFGYLGDTARPVPSPEVLRMIDALDGPIAVSPCRCRTAHSGCDHPLETDIVIRYRDLPERFWPVFDPSHQIRCWCLRSWRDAESCWKREGG